MYLHAAKIVMHGTVRPLDMFVSVSHYSIKKIGLVGETTANCEERQKLHPPVGKPENAAKYFVRKYLAIDSKISNYYF
jgi:hypothetical protein